MIRGSEISFFDSLAISATGLGMVLLELAMLAVLIIIMSKLADAILGKNKNGETKNGNPVKVEAKKETAAKSQPAGNGATAETAATSANPGGPAAGVPPISAAPEVPDSVIAGGPSAAAAALEDELEISAVIAAVCEAGGLLPHQMEIVSIRCIAG